MQSAKRYSGKREMPGILPAMLKWPIFRPRTAYEKFDAYGESCLSDTELLSILIKNGTRGISAANIASQVVALDHCSSGISFLCNLPVEDLVAIPGIGRVKAATIKCAVELGRRATRHFVSPGATSIKTPEDVADFLKEEMQLLPCEELRILLLDTKNVIMRIIKSSRGSVKETMFSPREIFKDAIKYNAASLILVHNHPSGNPEPSRADIETTADLLRISKELDIQMLDHIILAKEGFTSIKSLIIRSGASTGDLSSPDILL
ncbi:MAG: RadC family protein [Saccharofermentanales bacterium]